MASSISGFLSNSSQTRFKFRNISVIKGIHHSYHFQDLSLRLLMLYGLFRGHVFEIKKKIDVYGYEVNMCRSCRGQAFSHVSFCHFHFRLLAGLSLI